MYRTLLSILYCTMHCTMLYSTHTKAALYIVCETKARLQRPSFEMKSLPYSQFWVRPDSTCTNYWNYEITMLHIGKLSNYLFFLLCLKCSALGDDVMIREDGAPRPNVQVNILLGRYAKCWCCRQQHCDSSAPNDWKWGLSELFSATIIFLQIFIFYIHPLNNKTQKTICPDLLSNFPWMESRRIEWYLLMLYIALH